MSDDAAQHTTTQWQNSVATTPIYHPQGSR
jgi:hypothetical protein